MKSLTYCTTCLMPSTRPRIQFDDSGRCNACAWSAAKKATDWSQRWSRLEELCDRYRTQGENYDVIVPYSGGKNGAYIAYTLKEKLGMTPLCVTVRPPMEDSLGEQNIKNFLQRGYSHLLVSPNPAVEKAIDRDQFVRKGIPMHAFMIAVQTAILRIAVSQRIPFIMYAEEGESEYGGSTRLLESPTYSTDDGIELYLSGTDPEEFKTRFSGSDLYWLTYPDKSELSALAPSVCHWSFFENFVNYEHYLVAKEKLGLVERPERNIGAIENFSATDTDLIHIYFYLMYLKYGFGRTTSEVGNEIRRGAMDRNQGLALVKLFDGEFPQRHVPAYLNYYNMSEGEFYDVLDTWANRDLFERNGNTWQPTFEPS